MTKMVEVSAMKAQSMEDTFEAWRISPDSPRGEVCALDVSAATSLADAVDIAAPLCFHKDSFVVQVIDGVTGKRMLHFYAVKRRSNPIRQWNKERLCHENMHPHYAVAMFSMAVSAFEPVEPWRWSPGTDVVGLDGTAIEL